MTLPRLNPGSAMPPIVDPVNSFAESPSATPTAGAAPIAATPIVSAEALSDGMATGGSPETSSRSGSASFKIGSSFKGSRDKAECGIRARGNNAWSNNDPDYSQSSVNRHAG